MLKYQSITWSSRDQNGKFVIHGYGRTIKAQSVHVKITGFQPYHYIQIPIKIGSGNLMSFMRQICAREYCKIVKMSTVTGVPFNEFTGGKRIQYLKIVYNSSWSMRKICRLLSSPVPYRGKPTRLITCEAKLEPLLRFFHLRKIKPCGWIKIASYSDSEEALATTDIDIECSWKNVRGTATEDSSQAPLLVGSFDIECFSGDKRSFPDALKETDKVIQIGLTLHWYNHPDYKPTDDKACIHERWIGVLGSVSKVYPEDCIVQSYGTEKELIKGYCMKLKKTDPDVLVGHNIFGFDNKYLWDRAEMLGATSYFSTANRILGRKPSFREISMKSSAYGDNTYGLINLEGRVQIDTYRAIQREHKLESYSLKSVSQLFLNDDMNKLDLSPREIFEKFEKTAEDRAEIATYCVRDCELCNHLVHKLDILTSNIGMANVSCVPLSYLFVRGQSIKTQSQVAQECLKSGLIMKDIFRGDREKVPYEGAKVIDPIVGLHIDEVTVLDFNSLYPSVMISENISPDTLVMDKKYMDLPNYTYNEIKYRNPETLIEHTSVFATNNEHELGVLPRTLQKLLKARKDTRVLIKTETDPFRKKMLNSLQLAYKVSANSIYGALGADISAVYSPESAAAVTSKGRESLMNSAEDAKKLIKGTKIVYGDTDSIFITFPVPGDIMSKKDRIRYCIDKGVWLGEEISKSLKSPMNLEYEKVLTPFILFSRKRYVGNLYEHDPEKYVRKSMGIVTKRRDNAPLTKFIYTGLLDILLDGSGAYGDHDMAIREAKSFFSGVMERLLSNNIEKRMMTITKTLNSNYKFPDRIAHNVLAQRMRARGDPNTPQVNDRLAYMFVIMGSVKQHKSLKQGDRIEHPSMIKSSNSSEGEGGKFDIDYYAYIDHVKKPVLSLMKCITDDASDWFVPFFEKARKWQDDKYAPDSEREEVVAKSWKSGIQIIRVNYKRDLVLKYPLSDGRVLTIPIEKQSVSKLTLARVREIVESRNVL